MEPREFWWLLDDARQEAERSKHKGKRGLSEAEARELMEWMDQP
jgi:hypothetical protein